MAAIISDITHFLSLQRNKMEERTYNAALGLVQTFASWALRKAEHTSGYQNAYDNVWTQDGWKKRRLKKTANKKFC
jgi:hypothetical protein